MNKKSSKKVQYQIVSANDWLNKIGCKIVDGKIRLPMKHLIFPLMKASEEMEKYKNFKRLNEQMKCIDVIALNVRQADNAYFFAWSQSILVSNKKETIPEIFPCYNCFQKTISSDNLRKHFSSKLQKLRDKVSSEIIHAAEAGVIVSSKHFGLVEEYYNEFISLNMFYFSGIKDLNVCFCKEHERN
ncbi:MAG: hypothetical protein ACOZAR_03830 [Patescibacteria group bacterium]